MSGLADHPDQGIVNTNWSVNVSDIKTVRVNNVSLAVSKRDIEEFFSFSGDIQYVEMRSESETTQLAYVTFKDTQGADTAILLSGAVIGNLSVSITPVDDYVLPPEALASSSMSDSVPKSSSAMKAAEDVVSSMLAKGFILGKDAINKAKLLDERHGLVANASATVASIDHRIGLTEKLGAVNERYQVTEKTRSALAAAEQKASHAGSAIMSNAYVQSGASWLSSTLVAFSRAAEDVSAMTREKLERAEEDKKEVVYRERTGMIADFAHIHLDHHESSSDRGGGPPVVPVSSADHNNPAIV